MSVHIRNLKVRPTKKIPHDVCNAELAAMLGCWAAHGDILSRDKCLEATNRLYDCMRTTPIRGKQHRPSINYHLARLSKNLK